ncbi:MAG: SURF1 family protein [Gammaproteobacteria bacterium]|nr:SURF1 family protein [Gammaproteobacteria bacterium]
MTVNRILLFVGFPLLLALLLFLGMWQLNRAEQGASVYQQYDEESSRSAFTRLIPNGDIDEFRYRSIELQGEYLSSKQFLLDSMTHEGRAGYHVLTPFKPNNSSEWVLVNRGWVEANADREVLPQVLVNEAIRLVRGRVDLLPQPGLYLGESADSGFWPKVMLFPTFDALEARFESPLMHYQLLLDAGSSDGFLRVWAPRVLPPERHIGYAIQWFSFAGVLAIMVIAVNVRSRISFR